MDYSGKDVLVIGASGLIGGAICEELLDRGAEVYAIARFRQSGLREAFEKTGLRAFAADVADFTFPEIPDLPRHFDLVIHEAAIMLQAEEDRPYTWRTNAYSVAATIERFRDSGGFVIASTGGAYPVGEQARREGDPLGCGGTYGATKIAMEGLATYLANVHKLKIALLRYHWPFDESRGMVATVASQIWRDEEIEVDRGNRSIVHPMWIGDTVRMTLAAPKYLSAGEPYIVNIAGEEPIEREALIHRIAAGLGKEPRFREAKLPCISHVANLDKMHTDFGHCEVSLDDGIARVAAELKETRVTS